MPDQFLLEETDERRDVYAVAAAGTDLPPKIIEKDVWLCWTLDVLFSQDGCPQMAFKGGTSLSKVYGVIDRFSEDIDITIALDRDANAGLPASRSAAKRIREQVGAQLKSYLEEVVVPLVSSALVPYVDDPSKCITMLDDETVVLDYPSCFDKEGGYLAERVRMEFGARNRVVPSESHVITPYVTNFVSAEEVELPHATVDVLSAARTFWEKATLAHDECNRGQWDRGADRISRHWYDLARLSEHEVGEAALKDRDLLADVVAVKNVHFARSTSHYEDCTTGRIRLVPDQIGVDALRADYAEMANAGMFRAEPPDFDWVMDRVGVLEATINNGAPGNDSAPTGPTPGSNGSE
jgi:predicted nucleotidyltransferase component of viral defense system